MATPVAKSKNPPALRPLAASEFIYTPGKPEFALLEARTMGNYGTNKDGFPALIAPVLASYPGDVAGLAAFNPLSVQMGFVPGAIQKSLIGPATADASAAFAEQQAIYEANVADMTYGTPWVHWGGGGGGGTPGPVLPSECDPDQFKYGLPFTCVPPPKKPAPPKPTKPIAPPAHPPKPPSPPVGGPAPWPPVPPIVNPVFPEPSGPEPVNYKGTPELPDSPIVEFEFKPMAVAPPMVTVLSETLPPPASYPVPGAGGNPVTPTPVNFGPVGTVVPFGAGPADAQARAARRAAQGEVVSARPSTLEIRLDRIARAIESFLEHVKLPRE